MHENTHEFEPPDDFDTGRLNMYLLSDEEAEYNAEAGDACRAANLTLADLTPERLREAMAALRLVEWLKDSYSAIVTVAHGKNTIVWNSHNWDVINGGVCVKSGSLESVLIHVGLLEATDAL